MNPILTAAEPQRDCHPAPAVAESLVALLESRVADSPDRRAIVDGLHAASATRSAESLPVAGSAVMTWAELAAAALLMARRFEASGLARGDRLAHIGPHSADWIVVDLACLLTGMVHIALHAENAAHAGPLVEWIDARGVVTSGGATMPGGAGRVSLRAELEPDACRSLAADRDGLRADLQRRMAACDPDACATILLSSGTTGLPHGVMHSQRSLALNARAAADVFLDDPRDVRLSWLPMSHAMARTGDLYTTLVRGGCLNVVRDRTRLLDACRTLPPTVMLGVPIAFERLERETRAGRIGNLRAALGGGVRVCVSGGAPLRRRTAEFFAAAGVPLVEGYGLAEAGPVVAVASPRSYRPGTVGPPLAGVGVRIDDRPASRGQLLVRTPSRTIGILPPPGEARDGAPGPQGDADGWIETGDLAEIDDAGHIRITGRLRETLVLSTGVKLPPAVVELALAEDDVVAQVCVAGNGLPWPFAIVVPEPAVLRAAIHRLGVRVLSKRAALEHPRVLAWLGRRLAARQRHLPRAWQVRRVLVADRAFAADRGEITESFKLRRDSIVAHFGDRLATAAAPRGVGVVPLSGRPDDVGPRQGAIPAGSWTAACLWRGDAADGGGFEEAAAAAAGTLSESVAGVLDRTADALARLRAEGRLYDPPARQPGPAAPLADAPARPVGKFSRMAEAALGDAGLWGLTVPIAFGGVGGSMGDLVRAITRVAADCPTAAGMLAVHSSIGAVAALSAFGSADQQRRLLPGLAAGRPLSIFGGTEPEVGCDLAAVRAVLQRRDGGLLLTGTKMFITNAVHGRLVKLLARLDGRPQVALVRLPDADTRTFRLRHYDLHPLRHAHNAALEFHDFPIDDADLLAAPASRDGMTVVWHGLNRGRITLAAQATGTLRLLLAQARDHARTRTTWNAPIGSRQLVQGRLARIAAGVVACEAVTAWAARAVDTGRSGELEALVAKITASTCVREAAIDALGIHGGRAFLVGHPLGDSLHDHFAVTVYEGESDLLGLALFKGLAKHHPAAGGPSATRPLHRAAAWLAWRIGQALAGASGDRSILDAALRDHARRARRGLAAAALRIDRAIRRHGKALADLQLDAAMLAAETRDLMTVLAVAHHADARGDETTMRAADVWCRLALRRVRGGKPDAADHAALAGLGAALVSGNTAIP